MLGIRLEQATAGGIPPPGVVAIQMNAAQPFIDPVYRYPVPFVIQYCDPGLCNTNVLIPELADWVQSINAENEKDALKGDENFPLVLCAGLHIDTNANTLMRNPAWNKDRRACTADMHPKDAAALNLENEKIVKVITEAGEVKIELQVTEKTKPGFVSTISSCSSSHSQYPFVYPPMGCCVSLCASGCSVHPLAFTQVVISSEADLTGDLIEGGLSLLLENR